MTVEVLVDALCAWLDERELSVVDVAGNSLGGWLALELARRGRARSVVTLSPAGAWTAPRDMRRLAAALRIGSSLAGRPGAQRVLRSAAGRSVALGRIVARPGRIGPAQAERLVSDIAACSVLRELVGSAVRTGPVVPLPAGGCPVTLAWALQDRVIPWRRYGRPMLAAVPDARVVALRGVGHVPMSDDPELVASTILAGTGDRLHV